MPTPMRHEHQQNALDGASAAAFSSIFRAALNYEAARSALQQGDIELATIAREIAEADEYEYNRFNLIATTLASPYATASQQDTSTAPH